MKRIPITLILLFAVLMSCQSTPTVTGVSVTSVPAATGGKLTVFFNQSVTVKATVAGTGAFNTAVQWSLSPNDGSLIAKGNTATFAPKAAATYILTAISKADSNKRASVIMTVKQESPSAVVLNSTPPAVNNQVTLGLGQSATVNATTQGSNTANPNVIWTLAPNDGSLSESGNTATFKPKTTGSYTLTATSEADPSKSATLTFNVVIFDVLVNADPLNINPNQPSNLTATVKNVGGAVNWSVSPTTGASFAPPTPGNATVFTSSQTGTYTITATSVTNASLKGTVTVQVSSVTGVTLSAVPDTLGIGQTANLAASVDGQNNPLNSVTWKVTPSGGTLTPDGSSASFTANVTGRFVITATSVQDPSKSASASILVPWTGSRLLGTNGSDTITGSATDTDGNVYLSGFTTGALQGSNQGQLDAFLAKFDASGTPVWVRQLGSSKDDLAYSVAADGNGNVYVAGTTSGALAPSAGNDDAFVVKYDASGVSQWVSQFGTNGFENAFGVTVGPEGSVFVTGDTDGSFPGATNPDVGNTDAFVARLDPSTGGRVWTKQLGVVGNDTARGVAVDTNGNVNIGGGTEGSLPGNSSSLGRDAFIAQYNAGGTQTWVRQFGSNKDDEIKSIAVDAADNVFAAGQTDGALPGNASAGLGDALAAKYTANGTQAWVRQFGSSIDDGASGIATDKNGDAYISGQTDGVLPDNSSAGGTDAFLTKFDTSGLSQWTKQIGTASADVGFAVAIADRGSSLILAGYTEGSPFDGLPSNGGRDGFIAKYKLDGAR